MTALLNGLKGKKILIYGSGIWAKKLIDNLHDVAIVGILDRVKTKGEINKIPILKWENIQKGTADIIIIASKPQFYKEIYTRICGICLRLGITIYSVDGQDLQKVYEKDAVDIENALYYAKTQEELLNKIADYDAISFDVFDTLIMRKVLEPSDVFDMVEERLKKKGVEIKDLKGKRLKAEQTLGRLGENITIDNIYCVLQSQLNINDEICRAMQQEEMECELDNLMPRQSMLAVFNAALEQGKTVSLVSDMYYPGDMLGSFLKKLGIVGYHKLYVSCDYNKFKANGLFEEYMKDVDGQSCLHIGENHAADVIAPRKHGIDTFEICSAYRMLGMSSMSSVLFHASSKTDRLFLGRLVAELFNDPFALHEYNGAVRIDTVEQFANFFVPMVMLHMDGLYKLLDTGKFDTILFSSRDCYFMKKVYDAEILRHKKENVKSVYLYTSRRLVFKIAFSNIARMVDILHDYFGLKNRDDMVSLLKKYYETEKIDMQKIKELSSAAKRGYLKYMENNGIALSNTCLFCDFCSIGTVHKALNDMFNVDLQGYYLGKYEMVDRCKLNVVAPYDWQNADEYTKNFLEKVFTSPENSVVGMDEDGTPVFSGISKSEKEIDELHVLHESIIAALREKSEWLYDDGSVTPAFSLALVRSCFNVVLKSGLDGLLSAPLVDDVTSITVSEEKAIHFA